MLLVKAGSIWATLCELVRLTRRRIGTRRCYQSNATNALLPASTGLAARIARKCAGPLGVLIAASSGSAWGEIVSPTHVYWNGAEGDAVHYGSAGSAAAGGGAAYCAGAYGWASCSYGGFSTDGAKPAYGLLGFAIIVWREYPTSPVNSLPLVPVAESYICPSGYQLFPSWTENGVTLTPACYRNNPPPPPPPPKPPKIIAIDPGHGFSCPSKGMSLGAVGVTDFPTSDPPAGKLREDELVMAIAKEVQKVASPTKYMIVLTKASVDACPDFIDRGRVANNANAKVFVSIHINAAGFFATGTSAIYNSSKPASQNLANLMAAAVSANLGVNNRGSKIDNSLAVLKKNVTKMDAVVLEAARLSGFDEVKLHFHTTPNRISNGILSALDSFLGN